MMTTIKKRALHRAKILQGQMRGLEKMIEQDKYCIDILTQSLAIQRSLRSLNKLILENHLSTHVAEKLSTGKATDKKAAVEEMLGLYELFNIRSK